MPTKKKTTAKAITTVKKEVGLQDMVDREAANRVILTKFITDHMKKGTDYGGIMMGGRMSKDSLFKPGAEKIASLLKLRADIERDQDTWEMAGSKPGLFCYKCRLYNASGHEVGMGLGACDLSEKKTANIAIKIAKKRAFVDAVLTTGALSDFFTQDLEDGGDGEEYIEPVKTIPVPMINEGQIERITILLSEKGKTQEDLQFALDNAFHGKKLRELSQAQAKSLIDKLASLPDNKFTDSDIDMDEAEQAIDEAMGTQSKFIG